MKRLIILGLVLSVISACQTRSPEPKVVIEERGITLNNTAVKTRAFDEKEITDSTLSIEESNDNAVLMQDEMAIDSQEMDRLLNQRMIHFEYDSSLVRQQDYLILQAHARYLSENPEVKIRLEGHTDARGSREYNLALGERRALAVRGLLMLQGATASQFQVASFGEELPQVAGDNELAWQQNRRVELIYTGR